MQPQQSTQKVAMAEGERSLLELFSRAPERPKLSNIESKFLRGQLGPWRLSREEEHWKWNVIDASKRKIWQHVQWRSRPLSSEKKKGVERVLLIGESAAGSFGYGGDYCLSAKIQAQLNQKKERVDLVDLTSVNASWNDECLEAIRHGLTLKPDAVLVYCGNNEAKSLLANLASGAITENPHAFDARWAFEKADPKARLDALHRCLEFHIKNLVLRTVHLCRGWDKDVVFVIPESNLADCRPVEKIPHHLAGETLMSWCREIELADRAFAAGAHDDALGRYRAAIAIDGGMCQRSHYGEGHALLRLGEIDAAHASLERARDGGLGPFVYGLPGTTTGSARAIRDTLTALDVPFVDSPALFRKMSKSGVPDREMFIDYCHLSPRGHEVLGDAIASTIESVRHPRKKKSATQKQPAFTPSPLEQSFGALIAALHNHNLDQDPELVRHWLKASFDAWDGIAPLLRFLADNVCTAWRERWTMERLEAEMPLLRDLPVYYRFFVARFFFHARFDPELKKLLDDVLERSASEREESLLKQTGGLLRDVEYRLQSRFFLDRHQGLASVERRESRHGWERPFLEMVAVAPTAHVSIPWEDEGAATLEIELECMTMGNELTVCMDGKPVVGGTSIVIGQGFQKLVLPIDHVAKGMRELTLQWTSMTSCADAADAEARHAFIERFGHYPIAARIFGLSLRP